MEGCSLLNSSSSYSPVSSSWGKITITMSLFLAWPRGIQVDQTHIIPCLAKRRSSLSNTCHHRLYGQEAFKSTKHTLFLAWQRGVRVYQTHVTIACMAKRCSSLSNTCHHHLPGQEVFKSIKHSCQMRLGRWRSPNCSTLNSLEAVTLLALWSTLIKLIQTIKTISLTPDCESLLARSTSFLLICKTQRGKLQRCYVQQFMTT